MKMMQSWAIRLIVVLTWRPVPVLSAEPQILLNSATAGGETWRYTTEKPSRGWIKPEFDDCTWSDGKMRFGMVEEVADVVVMSATNGYNTGQTINVNGGWYMR